MLFFLVAFTFLLAQPALQGPMPDGVDPATRPRVSEPARGQIVIVVCPRPLQPALAPWIKYRQSQGRRFLLLEPGLDPRTLQRALREAARGNVPEAVLLIGRPDGSESHCPVMEIRAEVNVAFGSTPTIPTDSPFVDFDGDGRPDAAVARIPVSDPESLGRILARSIEYETSDDFGDWRRRINLVAGVGGFNPVLDRVIEGTAEGIIRQMMPEQYEVSMTWGSWTSPYCPDPGRFSQTAIERFNEGCYFWVYLGHGYIDRLDRVKTPLRSHLILDNTTVPWLSAQQGSPIALMLCCFTAAFDAEGACLAQAMLEQPRGPVAVIGGTRMTMPYGMGRLSMEMMEGLFHGDCETVGELLHLAKLKILDPVDPEDPDECRRTVEAMAQAFSPVPGKLEAELREHVAMMHLLGDPLLRIRRPLAIPTVAEEAGAGGTIRVRGEAPLGGRLSVEACYRRGRFWNRPAYRRESDLMPEHSARLQDDYEKCRDLVCSRVTLDVAVGPFSVDLAIPERASGEAVIRTFIAGTGGHAAGMTEIEIQPRQR